MAELSKEGLIAQAEGNITMMRASLEHVKDPFERDDIAADLRLAEIALAALTAPAEPVYQCEFCRHDSAGELQWHWEGVNKEFYEQYDPDRRGKRRMLYAAPQLPQSAVMDDEQSKRLFDEWSGGDAALGELRANGVPDEFISMLKEFSLATWEACREAMLKHSAPFIVTSDHCMMEMPKVEGIDAVADMLQGAEPVQGWIPCSERMPEEIGRYWCYVEEQNSLGKSHYQWNCSWNGDRWWVESENGGRVTHWMPMPAAPQQEADNG